METLNTEQFLSRLRKRLCEPAMLELTKRLIAIPSENPPGNLYEQCARTLVDELDRLGFDDVRREEACVLASVGSGSRTLYFSGHYDVVPAQSREQFQPRVEGANLFGRGSSGMKSGLAAMIHAAAAARDEGLLNTGRIGIVLVTPLCLRESIGVIPYFSQASGFLAGKYRSEADLANSARGTFVKKYLNERGFRILGALKQVAKTHDSTPTRVALAWLLTQPSVPPRLLA
jgi:hypothetical protein